MNRTGTDWLWCWSHTLRRVHPTKTSGMADPEKTTSSPCQPVSKVEVEILSVAEVDEDTSLLKAFKAGKHHWTWMVIYGDSAPCLKMYLLMADLSYQVLLPLELITWSLLFIRYAWGKTATTKHKQPSYWCSLPWQDSFRSLAGLRHHVINQHRHKPALYYSCRGNRSNFEKLDVTRPLALKELGVTRRWFALQHQRYDQSDCSMTVCALSAVTLINICQPPTHIIIIPHLDKTFKKKHR